MKEYKHFDLEERKKLFLFKRDGMSNGKIAVILGKHSSSIGRELKRNTETNDVGYLPDTADRKANKRKNHHDLKLNTNLDLQKKVLDKLEIGWSPSVISGRMKLEKAPEYVCHETIYGWIYSPEGNKKKAYKLLLRGKPKRNKFAGRKQRKPIIPDKTSIHDRPEEINNRMTFGGLEGDLTFNKGSQSINIATIIERKTRFTLLTKNSSKKTTEVMKNIFNTLAPIPREALTSITFDNGTEFVRHTLLKSVMKVDTYFCDPHSPWQKGQVEKTNSMIHRYIQKKKPLKHVSDQELKDVQDKLNNTPRKILGFKTPQELFDFEMSKFTSRRLNTPGAAEAITLRGNQGGCPLI